MTEEIATALSNLGERGERCFAGLIPFREKKRGKIDCIGRKTAAVAFLHERKGERTPSCTREGRVVRGEKKVGRFLSLFFLEEGERGLPSMREEKVHGGGYDFVPF